MSTTASNVSDSTKRAQETVFADQFSWGDRIIAYAPALSLLALCILFSLTTNTFFTIRNLLNVIDQLTVLGIMALGMTAVIQITVPEGWANFHLPWAAMALALLVFGGGKLSVDSLLGRGR